MDSDTSKKLAEVARVPSRTLMDSAAFVASPKDDVAATPTVAPSGTPKSTKDVFSEMCEDYKPGTDQDPIRASAQHCIHLCPLNGA